MNPSALLKALTDAYWHLSPKSQTHDPADLKAEWHCGEKPKDKTAENSLVALQEKKEVVFKHVV
jgi:hypothetical protein